MVSATIKFILRILRAFLFWKRDINAQNELNVADAIARKNQKDERNKKFFANILNPPNSSDNED